MALARERARIGNLIRHHPDDHEAIAAARRDLDAARIEAWLARQLAAAPDLTAEQVARLRALLPVPSAGSGDAE